jgi:lipopolysaccharide export system protein LptC
MADDGHRPALAYSRSADRWGVADEDSAWQDRHASAQDVSRYSRFVSIMKIVLPAIATLLIALLLLYSIAGREETVNVTMETMGKVDDDSQMVKPRLTGTDGQGHAFTVTAQSVGQELGANPRMTMIDVEGDVTLENGSWLKVEARTGTFDSAAKAMTLTGAIAIYSDMGYECHTEAAIYDIAKGALTGDKPIACQGVLGLIRGKSFEGLRQAEILTIGGGVSTLFYPPPRKAGRADPGTSPPAQP